MGYSIKCLAEVQYADVHLVPGVSLFHEVVCREEELGFAGVSFPESVVCGREDAMIVQMTSDVRTQDMLLLGGPSESIFLP